MRTMLAAVAVALTCVACGADSPTSPTMPRPRQAVLLCGGGNSGSASDASYITWEMSWRSVPIDGGSPVRMRVSSQLTVEPGGRVYTSRSEGTEHTDHVTMDGLTPCRTYTATMLHTEAGGQTSSCTASLTPTCAQ